MIWMLENEGKIIVVQECIEIVGASIYPKSTVLIYIIKIPIFDNFEYLHS